MWTIGITLPVYILSLAKFQVKTIISITGGIPGLYLLLLLPPLLAFNARKWAKSASVPEGKNFHKPTLSSNIWIYASWIVGLLILAYQLLDF